MQSQQNTSGMNIEYILSLSPLFLWNHLKTFSLKINPDPPQFLFAGSFGVTLVMEWGAPEDLGNVLAVLW